MEDIFEKYSKEEIIKETSTYLNSLYPNTSIDYIKEGLIYYMDIYNGMKQEGLDEPSIAVNMYRLIDKMIQTNKDKDNNYSKVTCKKGCSHCCKIAVCISHEEAVTLLIRAKEIDLKIDKKKLEIQSRFTSENWAGLKHKYASCVFLKNDQCQVYEYRPIVCRNHFSADDPKLCNIVKHKKRTDMTFWRPIEPEIISMVVTILGKSDYMAIKLLEILNKK